MILIASIKQSVSQMSLNMDASINFRVTATTKEIANKVCDRNGIKKNSDLHRMAYMMGMEIVMEMEKKAEGGDLMILLAYEISKRAKKRIS